VTKNEYLLIIWVGDPKDKRMYSMSDFKGKCAIKVFDRHLELKKQYWGRHFWAKGYCVSTVGLDEEKIRKYVRWQLAKDKHMEQLKMWR